MRVLKPDPPWHILQTCMWTRTSTLWEPAIHCLHIELCPKLLISVQFHCENEAVREHPQGNHFAVYFLVYLRERRKCGRKEKILIENNRNGERQVIFKSINVHVVQNCRAKKGDKSIKLKYLYVTKTYLVIIIRGRSRDNVYGVNSMKCNYFVYLGQMEIKYSNLKSFWGIHTPFVFCNIKSTCINSTPNVTVLTSFRCC